MRFLLLFLASVAYAQIGGGAFPGPGVKSYTAGSSSSSWEATPIAHGSVLGNGGGTTVSIGPLNCTGATHYFVGKVIYDVGAATLASAPGYDDGTPHTFSNVSGEATEASPTSAAIWWQEVTGSAAVTFSNAIYYGPLFASCWKIGLGSSSKDQESASGTVTCYPCSPSLTPTVNDSLVLAVGSTSAAGATAIAASGYTVLDSQPYTAGLSMGGAFLYRVLSGGSGAAQSPSFTNPGGSPGTVKMVNFKPL